jgi:hypothetical protein
MYKFLLVSTDVVLLDIEGSPFLAIKDAKHAAAAREASCKSEAYDSKPAVVLYGAFTFLSGTLKNTRRASTIFSFKFRAYTLHWECRGWSWLLGWTRAVMCPRRFWQISNEFKKNWEAYKA